MSDSTPNEPTPLVLAGPIVRRVGRDRLVLWLATDRDVSPNLALYRNDDGQADEPSDRIDLEGHIRRQQIGTAAWLLLIDIKPTELGCAPLPENTPIGYDMRLGGYAASLAELEPGLCYPDERRPRFIVRTRLDSVLHGSCRRPHNASGDGMARGDRWLAGQRDTPADWPTALLLTGDQIYADDVAGPLLRAIQSLIARLGLWPEMLRGALVQDSEALYNSEYNYYRRTELLPQEKLNNNVRDRFFGGTRKPVFTSATAGNHLITLAEVLAMYLLCWSDSPWRGLDLTPPALDDAYREQYHEQDTIIQNFVAELPAVRRLMANTPTAMIFDDHDVTDDWNLTALWEESAYGNPFSRRILGNALVAYFLCQGSGNEPEAFASVWPVLDTYLEQRDRESQDALIDHLLAFRGWEFALDTEPAVLMLDTRTRRWRRRRLPSRPSGLMDWEALTDMQQWLIDRDSAVLVSPAPVFGVKLIENIQKLFTWFGKPLMVDAENWMAHRGAARTLLNIFNHRRTPRDFTILSGDVHYSYVYDVEPRYARFRQRIWQITSSGVKNEFPRRLLAIFDWLNRWLYAPYSPLNWFTKRRRMRVSPRRPRPEGHGRRLVNGASIGWVRFDDHGRPVDIRELLADDTDVVFEPTAEREE